MRKSYFYLLMVILFIIESTQILFVLKFIDFFKEHNIEFIYPILFSMSITALGVMTYFLITGIWTLKYRK